MLLLQQVESLYQDAMHCMSVTAFNCEHKINCYLGASQLRMNKISAEVFYNQ